MCEEFAGDEKARVGGVLERGLDGKPVRESVWTDSGHRHARCGIQRRQQRRRSMGELSQGIGGKARYCARWLWMVRANTC